MSFVMNLLKRNKPSNTTKPDVTSAKLEKPTSSKQESMSSPSKLSISSMMKGQLFSLINLVNPSASLTEGDISAVDVKIVKHEVGAKSTEHNPDTCAIKNCHECYVQSGKFAKDAATCMDCSPCKKFSIVWATVPPEFMVDASGVGCTLCYNYQQKQGIRHGSLFSKFQARPFQQQQLESHKNSKGHERAYRDHFDLPINWIPTKQLPKGVPSVQHWKLMWTSIRKASPAKAFFDLATTMGLTGVGYHSLQKMTFVAAHVVQSEKRSKLKNAIDVSVCADAKGPVLGVSFVSCDYNLESTFGICSVEALEVPAGDKFVEKISNSITRFSSPGWSTRKAFPRGGIHDSRVQQSLENGSAFFADGASAAQLHMRMYCGKRPASQRVVVDRDTAHERKKIMENAVKRSEWASKVQDLLVSGDNSIVKKVTYSDACRDHWQAWQKAVVAKHGGQSGDCKTIFSNMSWGPQRYDSLCSPQTVLCRTVVASTLFVQDKVNESTGKWQRDGWQSQLNVMDGKSWILRGMLTDMHCLHNSLQVQTSDHKHVDPSIQSRLTRKFNYFITQMFLKGGVLSDLNSGTWTHTVLQQLVSSKVFVGKTGKVHVIQITGPDVQDALKEMQTIVVCVLHLNDAMLGRYQHSTYFECMDVCQWQKIFTPDLSIDVNEQYDTNFLGADDNKGRLLNFYERLSVSRGFPVLPNLFETVMVQAVKYHEEHRAAAKDIDDHEWNLVCLREGFFLALALHPRVEPLRRVVAYLLVYTKSTCNVERELYALGGKAAHPEFVSDCAVVKLHGPQSLSELVDEDGAPKEFIQKCCVHWAEFFGNCAGTRKSIKKAKRIGSARMTVKAKRQSTFKAVASMVSRRQKKQKLAKACIADLKLKDCKVDGLDVALSKAQADYLEFNKGVKRKLADAEKSRQSGTPNPYCKEVAEIEAKRQRMDNKIQKENVIRQQAVASEKTIFVPKMASAVTIPPMFTRTSLHDAEIILVDDIAVGQIPATGKMHKLTLWAALTGKRLAEPSFLKARRGEQLKHGTLKFNSPLTKQFGILFTSHFKRQNPRLYSELQRWLVPPSKWIELDETSYTHWMSCDRLRSKCTQIHEVIGLHDCVRQVASVNVKLSCSLKF